MLKSLPGPVAIMRVFPPAAFRYRSRDGIGDAVTAKAHASLKRSPRFTGSCVVET
jgi:hypothetical protein